MGRYAPAGVVAAVQGRNQVYGRKETDIVHLNMAQHGCALGRRR